MNEQDVINKIRRGNNGAYAELVRAYHPKVIRMCQMMMGNVAEAEDAAQDVFVRAFKAIDSFRGDSSFSTWLYRIAYRHCLDLLRQRKRQRTESFEQLLEEKGDKISLLLERTGKEKMSAEDKDLIHRVLSTLNPDYKNILILREVQGLTYEELATTLKTTVDGVKARLRRARIDLQKKCQPLLYPENTSIPEVSYEPR